MAADRRFDPLFRAIALLIAGFAVGAFMQHTDASVLARIDSMPAAAYMERQRHLHEHSYLYWYISFVFSGGILLGFVEFVVYVLRLFVPPRPVSPEDVVKTPPPLS